MSPVWQMSFGQSLEHRIQRWEVSPVWALDASGGAMDHGPGSTMRNPRRSCHRLPLHEGDYSGVVYGR